MTSQPTAAAAGAANTQPAGLKMNYNTAPFLDGLRVGPNQVNKMDGQLIESHNHKLQYEKQTGFLKQVIKAQANTNQPTNQHTHTRTHISTYEQATRRRERDVRVKPRDCRSCRDPREGIYLYKTPFCSAFMMNRGNQG